MKSLEEYLKLPYRLVLTPDPDEGGYVASYPDLPGYITCAPTIEAAIAAVADAKRAGIRTVMITGLEEEKPPPNFCTIGAEVPAAIQTRMKIFSEKVLT